MCDLVFSAGCGNYREKVLAFLVFLEGCRNSAGRRKVAAFVFSVGVGCVREGPAAGVAF